MRRSIRTVLTLSCAVLVVGMHLVVVQPADEARAQRADADEAFAAGRLAVPAPPRGTPEELLQFAEGLLASPPQSESREEWLGYMEQAGNVGLQVAERVLAQAKPGDRLHSRAARLKMDCLATLGQMGSERAAADLAAYATTLVDGPDAGVAREARRRLILAEGRAAFSEGNLDAAAGLVRRTAELLAADPDDTDTVRLALQLAEALEQIEGGEKQVAAACAAFAPLLAKSGNQQVRELADRFAGTLRRLSLPGTPMEIAGTRLDGGAFDQRALAGKVVLVDFWATWCGPCVAEIPNILAQYEKYHDRGFEVVGVSLDEDRDEVARFVADNKLPWPILFGQGEGVGWQHPLARKYGISGIPQLILIGRDGNVITLDARGDSLVKRLAELFPDAR